MTEVIKAGTQIKNGKDIYVVSKVSHIFGDNVVYRVTLKHNIVDFNPSTFEDSLFSQANKVLESRGVRLNSLTFVTVPDEQTRMAIDAATAINVYKAKGLFDFGQKLAIAKAGAAKINLSSQQEDKR